MFIVYRHINLKNGKSYVGYTKFTMQQRWEQHVENSAKATCAFACAIRKYGIHCWKHEVLETIETSREDALQREAFWIECCKSYAKFNTGYNETTGGLGGYEMTDEYRQRISEGTKRGMTAEVRKHIGEMNKVRDINDETREKHRQQMLKDNNAWKRIGPAHHSFGTHKTEKSKQLFRDKMCGRKFSDEHVFAMKVSRTIPIVALKDDNVEMAFLFSDDLTKAGFSAQQMGRASRGWWNYFRKGYMWKKLPDLDVEKQRVAVELLKQQYDIDTLKYCNNIQKNLL